MDKVASTAITDFIFAQHIMAYHRALEVKQLLLYDIQLSHCSH